MEPDDGAALDTGDAARRIEADRERIAAAVREQVVEHGLARGERALAERVDDVLVDAPVVDLDVLDHRLLLPAELLVGGLRRAPFAAAPWEEAPPLSVHSFAHIRAHVRVE